MYARRIDAALLAMRDCRAKLPFLQAQFRPETREARALELVLLALRAAETSLVPPRRPDQPG
jgi:hypothetical protein